MYRQGNLKDAAAKAEDAARDGERMKRKVSAGLTECAGLFAGRLIPQHNPAIVRAYKR